MKDDFKTRKWNTAADASAASYLEMLLRNEFDDKMNSFISLHPIIKMYFDSELSSEIEKNAFLAITDAIYTIIDASTNQGLFQEYNVIGVEIAHIVCNRLYLLKLIYHANSGRITRQQFCELSAKHLAVDTAAFVNTLWDFLGEKLPNYLNIIMTSLSGFLSSYCNISPSDIYLISETISGIFSALHPKIKEYITPEKIEDLLKNIIEYTIDSARQVLIYTEETATKVKSLYTEAVTNLKSWGRMICQKYGWKEWDFLREEENYRQEDKDVVEDEEVKMEEDVVEDEEVKMEEDMVESGSISQPIFDNTIGKDDELYIEMNK